jgi:hypothetical protein
MHVTEGINRLQVLYVTFQNQFAHLNPLSVASVQVSVQIAGFTATVVQKRHPKAES